MSRFGSVLLVGLLTGATLSAPARADWFFGLFGGSDAPPAPRPDAVSYSVEFVTPDSSLKDVLQGRPIFTACARTRRKAARASRGAPPPIFRAWSTLSGRRAITTPPRAPSSTATPSKWEARDLTPRPAQRKPRAAEAS